MQDEPAVEETTDDTAAEPAEEKPSIEDRVAELERVVYGGGAKE